jgi:flagellar protein FliS
MSYAMSQYAYKRVGVETASQEKLVLMLFDGAVQRAEKARRALENGTAKDAHAPLIRAQEIIAELRSSLNMDVGEIAANLDRIYEYIQHLLVQANVRKDPAPLAEAIEHMQSMRDTWEQAFALAGEAPAATQPKPQLPNPAAGGRLQGGTLNFRG